MMIPARALPSRGPGGHVRSQPAGTGDTPRGRQRREAPAARALLTLFDGPATATPGLDVLGLYEDASSVVPMAGEP